MDKLVIFDFDGVLADSYRHTYAINRLAAEFVLKKITEEDYKKMFVGKFHQNLFNFLNLKKEELEKFLSFKYKIYNNYYSKVDLYEFVPDLIKNLSKIASLAIISSAPEEAIQKLLNKNNLADYFFMIIGMNKDGKINNIKKCISSVPFSNKGSFFISDTVGDIIEGKEADIKTIATTWGFHEEDILRRAHPDFIVYNYSEIINIVSG